MAVAELVVWWPILPAAAAAVRCARPTRALVSASTSSFSSFRWPALLSLFLTAAPTPPTSLAFPTHSLAPCCASVLLQLRVSRRSSTLFVPNLFSIPTLTSLVGSRHSLVMAPSSTTSRTSLRAKRQATSGMADGDDTSDDVAAVVGSFAGPTRASPPRAVKPPLSSKKPRRSKNTSVPELEAPPPPPTPPAADVTPSPPKRGVRKASPKASRDSVTTEESTSKDDASETDPSSPRATAGAGTKSTTTTKKAKAPSHAKAPPHQVLTERDELPRLWSPDKSALVSQGSYPMKIVSWNVCGLRALLNKSPDAISQLVREHDVDVLCLQETKIQDSHVEELGLDRLIPGYDAYYSCSRARKGYSGTAAFVRKRIGVPSAAVVGAVQPAAKLVEDEEETTPARGKGRRKKQKTLDGFFAAGAGKKSQSSEAASTNEDDAPTAADEAAAEAAAEQLADDGLPPEMRTLLVPESVNFAMGVDKHDEEGRILILHFPSFTMCNLYVPNSGQALARLSYRVDEWDKDWLSYCQTAQKTRPVLWLGDLNVAHTNLEVWNDGARHLPKQAGVTPEERASFQHQLDAGFVDAFRRLHPQARGHYSYWSQRANNRPTNKGLRLDYFVCDPSFFGEGDVNVSGGGAAATAAGKAVVRDSYMLHEIEGSDHCPVVLELEVKL